MVFLLKNRGFSFVTALFNKTLGKSRGAPVYVCFRSLETADDRRRTAIELAVKISGKQNHNRIDR